MYDCGNGFLSRLRSPKITKFNVGVYSVAKLCYCISSDSETKETPHRKGRFLMARRRMFSLDIVDTDTFLDMPQTSQLLYYHLCMRADDDGFITPKKVMRMVGAQNDDLRVLIAKRYLLAFPSGVVVIKHWPLNNTIQKDRHKNTTYAKELKSLTKNEFGAYTEIEKIPDQITLLEENQSELHETVDISKNTTTHRSNIDKIDDDVYSLDTQVRLGKVRLDKVNNTSNTNVLLGDNLADNEISKLYYQAIKALKLPVRNHNNVKATIKKILAEKNDEENIKYLEFLVNKFDGLEYDYKPSLNEALEIYTKRKQIINSIKRVQANELQPAVFGGKK